MIQTIKTSTMVAIVVVIVRVIGVIMMIMMTMTIITLATIVSINNSDDDDDDDDDDDGDDDHHHHHHHHRHHVKPKALQLCFRQHVTCGRQVVHVIFLFEGACLSIISAYSPQLPDTGNSEISEVTIFSILSVSIAPPSKPLWQPGTLMSSRGCGDPWPCLLCRSSFPRPASENGGCASKWPCP